MLNIAIVAFNEISPFHLSIPFAVFGEDRRLVGVPRNKVVSCCFEKGPIITTAGYHLSGLKPLRALEQADLVIVPSWRNPFEMPPRVLLRALVRAKERGAVLVGLCLGSFVLAAAGLLDGYAVTTHWEWAGYLAVRYPNLEVRREALYLDQGKVITSAGSAAGLDCCLHLLRRFAGEEIALTVARRMVVAPHRQGDQAQFIETPIAYTPEDVRLSQLLAWVTRHLGQTHQLDAMAKRAAMSRRTFTRRFKKVTGTTFGKWLLNQRLIQAKKLLESTDRSIERIAEETGFGTATSLRFYFKQEIKLSPVRYRKSFTSGA